jgi:hypothetical protein
MSTRFTWKRRVPATYLLASIALLLAAEPCAIARLRSAHVLRAYVGQGSANSQPITRINLHFRASNRTWCYFPSHKALLTQVNTA